MGPFGLFVALAAGRDDPLVVRGERLVGAARRAQRPRVDARRDRPLRRQDDFRFPFRLDTVFRGVPCCGHRDAAWLFPRGERRIRHARAHLWPRPGHFRSGRPSVCAGPSRRQDAHRLHFAARQPARQRRSTTRMDSRASISTSSTRRHRLRRRASPRGAPQFHLRRDPESDTLDLVVMRRRCADAARDRASVFGDRARASATPDGRPSTRAQAARAAGCAGAQDPGAPPCAHGAARRPACGRALAARAGRGRLCAMLWRQAADGSSTCDGAARRAC